MNEIRQKKSHLLAIGFLRLFGCCANPRACALVPFSFKLIPTTFEELDASVGYFQMVKLPPIDWCFYSNLSKIIS